MQTKSYTNSSHPLATSVTSASSADELGTANGWMKKQPGALDVMKNSASVPAWEPTSLQMTLDILMSSAPASPARMSLGTVTPALEPAESAVDSPSKPCESSMNSDQLFCCLRTFLLSSPGVTTHCTKVWRKSTTPANHSWWELMLSEPAIDASGYGLLPTIRFSEYKGCGPKGSKSHTHWLQRSYLSAVVTDSGKLNPTFAETVDGNARWMDRLKVIGNAVVPQIPVMFFDFMREVLQAQRYQAA